MGLGLRASRGKRRQRECDLKDDVTRLLTSLVVCENQVHGVFNFQMRLFIGDGFTQSIQQTDGSSEFNLDFTLGVRPTLAHPDASQR